MIRPFFFPSRGARQARHSFARDCLALCLAVSGVSRLHTKQHNYCPIAGETLSRDIAGETPETHPYRGVVGEYLGVASRTVRHDGETPPHPWSPQ